MSDNIKEMRSRFGKAPIVIAYSVAIVLQNNKILLEERADDGFFDFPGGAVEIKETVEEAAARELFEETGLIADNLEFFKIYSGEIAYYKYANGDEVYGVDIVYLVNEYHGEIKCQESEVKKISFYDLNNLPSKFSVRNKQIIKDIKERLKYEN